MKKSLFFPLQVSLCTVSYLWATGNNTLAQVTPDASVNTTVNQNGNVDIKTNNFNATNFSFLITDNQGLGEGNAGDINLTATDSIIMKTICLGL